MITSLMITMAHRHRRTLSLGLKIRFRSATTASFGTVKDSIPGAKLAVLKSKARRNDSSERVDECRPIPAAMEAVMRAANKMAST